MDLPTTFPKLYTSIGLMSGTSLDGVDVACVETDGQGVVVPREFLYVPYPADLREKLRACFGARQRTSAIDDAERELTLFHVKAVREFMTREGLTNHDVDVVGFHGQTITHDPDHKFTWQLGDGKLLAAELGIDVVNNFRTKDVSLGGHGAPLIPVYHYARARVSNLECPVAILNIGGVSNVTWIGGAEEDVIAFDCGPGNALIDDLVLKATGERFDKDAGWARQGRADAEVLSRWLAHPFFDAQPPKSLDRDAWDVKTISNVSLQDSAATLTEFTVRAIVKGASHFPQPATAWYVTGGGRLNPVIMDGLRNALKVPVEPVDQLGWNGDALEAEGFAYMAVRHLQNLPISFPKTTGVPSPCVGGELNKV
ncbi:MAG TPA: anhydro-N-acetylmuramic acid kinase [Alphaproteobacteria bacterium]|nr:anhydro-N-acetylmuramic acid kinase [Alphaproteobacteria bacterium]HNS44539.1 anhydro-N-acetylmuramic acid kinase [Alphaproteobacteria bacterium]